MDATEMLFIAHARTITQLSKKRQAIAKMQIAKIIMEQELLDIEERSSPQQSRASSVQSSFPSSVTASSTSYASPSYECNLMDDPQNTTQIFTTLQPDSFCRFQFSFGNGV
ncbi:hypothetical protein NQ318_003836 [Aromia moschata]|uniref:Uncharacterized protein n=1 Tax=Aromia moschata TaxID=1265417 RepID=A0AAV8X6R5_9CUCU|nr:hypothetical protein NQ318_003836 [Aromia moschata]